MCINMDTVNSINNDVANNSHKRFGHYDDDTSVAVAPSTGASANSDDNQVVTGRVGRKRKTRRFKSRYKGKICKKSSSSILKLQHGRRRVYPQSEAPYNSNQFLMAEHTIENLDDKLVKVPDEGKRGGRHRDPSFTSVDSDEDQFYSSPEDEDEFLSKDFADTYQSVCAEKFSDLSKDQLTKIIFELEAQVEKLQQKLASEDRMNEMSDMMQQMNGSTRSTLSGTGGSAGLDSGHDLKALAPSIRIQDIVCENERLRRENEALKKFIKENAVATSTTSSSSSDESDGEIEEEMKGENLKG